MRKADRRLVLRETAQTSPEDVEGLQDLDRHRYCNTNNVWIDLRRLADELEATGGVLDLPLIRNEKTVDPGDPTHRGSCRSSRRWARRYKHSPARARCW